MAYDSARDCLVLVGLQANGNPPPETWEHDGQQWIYRGTFASSQAQDVVVVYDSARQLTVAVVYDGNSQINQTWEWNGTSWQQRSPPTSPPRRVNFGLAYDSLRDRTVLFGGGYGGVDLGDTWEWDGTTWQQRSNGGPPGREETAMTFDSSRGVTVLFGGYTDAGPNQMFGDTWEWNGSYWLQHFGASGPLARCKHRMAFDTARNRTVLYGGLRIIGGGAVYIDTWEWNGTAWTNMQATNPASSRAGMAYDSLRQRTMLFGGLGPGNVWNVETWGYALDAPASTLLFGSGCAGPTGVPQISPYLGSLPKLGHDFTVELSNLPAGLTNPAIGIIGFDNTTWNGMALPYALDPLGFPGCTAYLAPSQSQVFFNLLGTVSWSLPIPFIPAFSGTSFYLQGSVLVIGFNPGGLVFTNAVEAVIGT